MKSVSSCLADCLLSLIASSWKHMCGIVGYVGNKQVVPLIIDGLRKLEYRGYDSAGIAVVNEDHELEIRRAEGKLRNLEEAIRLSPLDGTYGIGHTRWATHGRPPKKTRTRTATAPAASSSFTTASSRIICNSKSELRKNDHQFVTETDTEIIAHLIEEYLKQGSRLSKRPCATPCWNCAASSRCRLSTPTSPTRSSLCARARRS